MNAPEELAVMKIEVGERLKAARLDSGFTQKELAEMTSLNRSSIIALEKGRKSPRFPTLWKVASALDVPLSELFEGIEQQIDSIGVAKFR